MTNTKHILITGASSGIGKALALYYAMDGVVLSLSGRNAERLDNVARVCRERGADVDVAVLDVCDAQAMREWIVARDTALIIDLVIANAGISAGTATGGEDAGQVNRVFETNVQGVFNTIHPAIDRMRSRKSGQIALMSSLAGYRGWGSAPAYCASKAAVRIYGQALREFLQADNIQVNVICPGFVRSPMTAVNDFPMPFLMESGQAVQKNCQGFGQE